MSMYAVILIVGSVSSSSLVRLSSVMGWSGWSFAAFWRFSFRFAATSAAFRFFSARAGGTKKNWRSMSGASGEFLAIVSCTHDGYPPDRRPQGLECHS
jgi:hypothetical protein